MSDFKGIWIPAKLWECNKLTLMEKLFLVQINSLDNGNGCTASNAFFCEFFDVTKSRCSQILKSLEDKKMISITLKRDGKMIAQRVCKLLNLGMYYFKFGYVENYTGYVENAKENNKDKEINNPLLEGDNEKDLRQNKQIPFDVVSASKTLNATYQIPFLELKEDIKNIFQIEAKDEDIKKAIFTFSTVAVASHDKYKGIRDYAKLCDSFKNWIPKSIKFEKEKSQKAETGEQPPEQLESYLLKHYQQKEVEYFKKDGRFEKWESELKENRFRLTNMAKGYKNENITPLLLFEMFYLPLSYALNGSSPTRKQEAFERLFAKQTQYNQDKGDFRQIIKQEYEKQKA